MIFIHQNFIQVQCEICICKIIFILNYLYFNIYFNINSTDAHGVILLFDLTSRITYKNLPNLYRDITRICGNIPIVICGNKLDLHNKRKIPKEKITYPKKKNLPYFEISIKKMIDIHQPILYLLRQLTGLHNLQFVNQSSSYCPILDQYICDFPIWDDIFGAIHTPLDDSDNDNDDNNNK